ncbi:LuxR C-terminal-related transcriptional regulator [Martelella sp. HB161492]|uniref:LuxR C-terminal-related transcriptional regulator n=1 Tax=Martelella sp. HB161492 TaxID=2720726 RepID=UPI00158FC79D|nr:LuxR C-terminal-related transcriptional regulator [Martelella sp. HB161492]
MTIKTGIVSTGQPDSRPMPPRNALKLLARAELESRLAAGLEGQVVLIQAPAGYGKTELMAKLFRTAERRGRRALWFSLATEDAADDVEQRLAASLGADAAKPGWLDAFCRSTAAIIELYFDDAGRMQDPAHLAWLLDRLPDNVRIAIAGRRVPELPLSRLRMRGLLAELTARHLQFSRGEVRQLLGPWLTHEEIERVHETLGGWPALNRLALIELERGVKGLERTALIAGQSRVYREFLHEEVFPYLDAMELRVLKAVEGIDEFTLKIAAALADLPYDYGTLRKIERLSPLIETEEQNAGWLRLSPVAASALEVLHTGESDRARKERHIRAARLFAENGNLAKSVLHASIAGEYDLAVRTIEQAGGVELFLRAGYTVLRGIIRAVPHAVVLKTPSLRLCRAVMLAKTGRIGEARAVLDALLEDTRMGHIPASEQWVGMLRHIDSLSEVYEDRAMDLAGITWLREEADGERRENTWRLGWIYNHLTICYTRMGELDAASATAERGLALYQEERSTYPQAFMLIHLGFVNMLANNLHTALDYLDQAFKIIHAQYWNDANLLAIANVPLAGVRYRQGRVKEAGELMQRDVPIMENGEGWVDFYVEAYSVLSRARMAESGLFAAQEVLESGVQLAHARNLPRLRQVLSILRLELQTFAGALDAAEMTIQSWPSISNPADWPTHREWWDATIAISRLRLRQGEHAEAAALLEALAATVRGAGRAEHLLRTDLLLAEAYAQAGKDDAAVAALSEAAALALASGQIQYYRDEGRAFAETMRKLVRRVGLSRMGNTTSQYLAAVVVPEVRRIPNGGLLSRREAEVLSLLAEGLPNKAIARRLNIGEPTVKFHLKNLFAKLGVSRRSLAVSVARQSGLLAQDPPSGAYVASM